MEINTSSQEQNRERMRKVALALGLDPSVIIGTSLTLHAEGDRRWATWDGYMNIEPELFNRIAKEMAQW